MLGAAGEAIEVPVESEDVPSIGSHRFEASISTLETDIENGYRCVRRLGFDPVDENWANRA
jgi:hypothetical protein